jgi:hypothetical protein
MRRLQVARGVAPTNALEVDDAGAQLPERRLLVVETLRYRTPVDPFLVLLAAAALVTGVGRARRMRTQRSPALAGRR